MHGTCACPWSACAGQRKLLLQCSFGVLFASRSTDLQQRKQAVLDSSVACGELKKVQIQPSLGQSGQVSTWKQQACRQLLAVRTAVAIHRSPLQRATTGATPTAACRFNAGSKSQPWPRAGAVYPQQVCTSRQRHWKLHFAMNRADRSVAWLYVKVLVQQERWCTCGHAGALALLLCQTILNWLASEPAVWRKYIRSDHSAAAAPAAAPPACSMGRGCLIQCSSSPRSSCCSACGTSASAACCGCSSVSVLWSLEALHCCNNSSA